MFVRPIDSHLKLPSSNIHSYLSKFEQLDEFKALSEKNINSNSGLRGYTSDRNSGDEDSSSADDIIFLEHPIKKRKM